MKELATNNPDEIGLDDDDDSDDGDEDTKEEEGRGKVKGKFSKYLTIWLYKICNTEVMLEQQVIPSRVYGGVEQKMGAKERLKKQKKIIE